MPEPALDADLIERVRAIADWRVIDNAQPAGFGRNHNAAFEQCDSECFAVVNPDITWAADPVTMLHDALENDPGLGVVAPSVLSPAGHVENTARALYSIPELVRQKWRPANVADRPAWLAGMFLCFRSAAFEDIGGFDERFHLYVEDVDVCSRLRLAGWQLRQIAAVTVVHDARRDSHRSWQHTRWHLAGMTRYWSSPVFWRYRALLDHEQRHHPAQSRGLRR